MDEQIDGCMDVIGSSSDEGGAFRGNKVFHCNPEQQR